MRYVTYGNEDYTVFSFVRFVFSRSPMNCIVFKEKGFVFDITSEPGFCYKMMLRSFSIDTQFANLPSRFRSIRLHTL